MREIEFRAKDKENHWRYGDLWNWHEETVITVHSKDKWGHNYFCKPETVGQYTGFEDIIGNKIFEGDIIQFRNHFYKVEYLKDYQMFGLVGKNDIEHSVWVKNDIRLIGNIHDNPELIKGSETK